MKMPALRSAVSFGVLAAALLLVQAATAQTPPQTLFPGLTDDALRSAIVSTYGLASAPSDSEGKDLLYSVIDVTQQGGQSGAAGLYTDFFVPFDCDPSCDPSQDVFNDGAGLNQEHSWPKSQGADSGLFERDLHHLFPSKVNVNADRGSLPFGDSPDAETTAWYYLASVQSTAPPTATRDLWSERQSTTRFEPRESRQGDVARAMFHAYTLYGPDGSGQASTSFWDDMRPYLLAWHRADPATAADRARSDRVADHQTTVSGADAINPFVVDSSLAARALYPETLPTGPDVSLSAVVTSGATVPSTGGEACFSVTLTNNATGAQPLDVWFTASGPTRLLVTRYLQALTLAAGQTVTGGFCQTVPGTIGDGTYVVVFNAGEFASTTVYASDGVFIQKGGVAAAAVRSADALSASPNPFAEETTVRFALAEDAYVHLAVYDLLGREVAVLVDGARAAGAHAARLDGATLPAGVYVYRLTTGSTAGRAGQTGRITRR